MFLPGARSRMMVAAVFAAVLVVSEIAHADVLIYAYKEKGKEYRGASGTGQAAARKVDASGLVLLTMDGKGNFGKPFLVLVDDKAGEWSVVPLGSSPEFRNLSTTEGMKSIISSNDCSAAGSMDMATARQAARQMKGARTWSRRYSDGMTAVGSAVVTMALDAKASEACDGLESDVNAAAAAGGGSIGAVSKALAAALELPAVELAWAVPAAEMTGKIVNASIDDSLIGYNGPVKAMLVDLAVGSGTSNYRLPQAPGNPGDVMTMSDSGATSWQKPATGVDAEAVKADAVQAAKDAAGAAVSNAAADVKASAVQAAKDAAENAVANIDAGSLKAKMSLSKVENKTAAEINAAMSKTNVESALGYTPYSAANPSGYVTKAQSASSAPVQSVNGRTGSVLITSSDVTGALGYTPANSAATVKSFNTRSGDVSLQADDLVNALGYTPYSADNPSGYVTSEQASYAAPVRSVAGRTGEVTLTATDVGLDRVSNVKNNYAGETAPTASDDETQGYSMGSLWFSNNEWPQAVYVCSLASESVAVWHRIRTTEVSNAELPDSIPANRISGYKTKDFILNFDEEVSKAPSVAECLKKRTYPAEDQSKVSLLKVTHIQAGDLDGLYKRFVMAEYSPRTWDGTVVEGYTQKCRDAISVYSKANLTTAGASVINGANLTDGTVTSAKVSGTIGIDKGGTGAATAAAARANLDVHSTTEDHNEFLDSASNLSDLANRATSRTNLMSDDGDANHVLHADGSLGHVITGDIADDQVTVNKLAHSLAFPADAYLNLSGVGVGANNVGIRLPQSNGAPVATTADGQMVWDYTNDRLYVGTGAGVTSFPNLADMDTRFVNEADHTKAAHDALGLDHGSLGGLGDDDHAQYYNQARGDARYAQRANNLSDLGNAGTARTNLDVYSKGESDARYVNEVDHTKAAHDALGLDHGSLGGLGDDDHAQYYNQARGDARYAQRANNLSDLSNAGTARTNLDVYSKGESDARYVNEVDHTKAAHDALGLDHGSLGGLGDDDHAQYYNQARGDARYIQSANHTKAAHDALAIDADTVDGQHAAAFAAAFDANRLLSATSTAGIAHTARRFVVDQKSFGGSGGLTITGLSPGANWGDLSYSVFNDTNDVLFTGITGVPTNKGVGTEAGYLSFWTSVGGAAAVERMRMETTGVTVTGSIAASNIGTVAAKNLSGDVGEVFRGDGTWGPGIPTVNHNLISATHPDSTTAAAARTTIDVYSKGEGDGRYPAQAHAHTGGADGTKITTAGISSGATPIGKIIGSNGDGTTGWVDKADTSTMVTAAAVGANDWFATFDGATRAVKAKYAPQGTVGYSSSDTLIPTTKACEERYEPIIAKNNAFNKNYGGSGAADSIARSDHNHSGVYEVVGHGHDGLQGDYVMPLSWGSNFWCLSTVANAAGGFSGTRNFESGAMTLSGGVTVDASLGFMIWKITADDGTGNVNRPDSAAYGYVSSISVVIVNVGSGVETASFQEDYSYAYCNPNGTDVDINQNVRAVARFAGLGTDNYIVRVKLTLAGSDTAGDRGVGGYQRKSFCEVRD